MYGPRVELSSPPSFFFNFPPAPEPAVLPPAIEGHPLRSLFQIDPAIYKAALDPSIPITIALLYLVSVKSLSAYNRRNGFKPWAISKTNAFQAFVLLHNIGLACYSALTFVAMARAARASFPSVLGPQGFLGTIDGFCKINGPRGLGDAVTYDPSKGAWSSKNPSIKLAITGEPDPTDVGRIWNEGLAFWGWFFYLSKFYEVVDTLVILAKGKRSSTLQTYHHTGAMFCMWAGIRYMSPPIWMFVGINSGIHAVMYTYYTLAALKVPVPSVVKRTITTLQIVQFLVGATYAALHLFVSYTVPVRVPFQVASALATAPSAVLAAVSEDKHSWFKKLVLRAGGAEGLAERVTDSAGHLVGPEHSGQGFTGLRQPRLHTDYQLVRCLDTNGAAFAVWLNVLYLAPLTFLFMRFFWNSYIARTPTDYAAPRGSKRRISQSAAIAAKEVTDAVEEFGSEIEQRMSATARQVLASDSDSTQTVIKATGDEDVMVVKGEGLLSGSGEQRRLEQDGRTTKVVQEIDIPGGERVIYDRQSVVDNEGNIRVQKTYNSTTSTTNTSSSFSSSSTTSRNQTSSSSSTTTTATSSADRKQSTDSNYGGTADGGFGLNG